MEGGIRAENHHSHGAGVRKQALARGMIDEATWEAGIRDLHETGTAPHGVFCYTFFKGVGVKSR